MRIITHLPMPHCVLQMDHSRWRKAVIISSTDSIWFESGLVLATSLEARQITVLRPAAFEPGKFSHNTLSLIKRQGLRFVVVLAYEADEVVIASYAQTQGLTSGWAWLLTYPMTTIAPPPALQGWLHLRPVFSEGMQAFAEQVSDYTKSGFNLTLSADAVDRTYSAALHDAILLYAHAATRVLSEGGDLRDGRVVTAAVRNTTFLGVGNAVVALDEQGDRVESYEMANYVVKADGTMGSVPVGVYNHIDQQYTASKQAVVWPGGTLEVPLDYLSGAHGKCCSEFWNCCSSSSPNASYGLICNACFCVCIADEQSIHLALLSPLAGVWVLRGVGAAALAVEQVNANKTLLPGHALQYSWADSGCSAKQGLKAMGQLLGSATSIYAVIGPGCSSACEVTSFCF